MKLKRKTYLKVIKFVVENHAKIDANSTSCLAVYQPKTPAMLKKYSKLEKW